MKKTIVTILSTNYAGSHFLSLLLGSHSRASHIGELRRVVGGKILAGEVVPCDLCDPPANCPTMRKLAGVNPSSAYDRVFENFAEDGQHPSLLVDNSKTVDWARAFLDNTKYEFKYIHLIRDPRAFIRRYIQNIDSLKRRLHVRRQAMFRGTRQRLGMLLAPQWKTYLARWYDKNLEICTFLRRYHPNHQLVTYRDLAVDTSGELSRLMAWLGQKFEPQQVEYWTFRHHGSQKISYEWIKQQRKSNHLDVRWKEVLAPEIAEAVACDREVVSLLDELQLSLDELGLSRIHRQPAMAAAVRFATARQSEAA